MTSMFVEQADLTDEAPLNEGGNPFPFVLNARGHAGAVYSDNLTELVEGLIDGYSDVEDDGEALWLRVQHLSLLAWQAQVASLLYEDGLEDSAVRDFDEDVITAIFADKLDILDFERWDVEYPLFLLSTSYAPYTPAPRPHGDFLVWLDPYSEQTYLSALAVLRIAEVRMMETF